MAAAKSEFRCFVEGLAPETDLWCLVKEFSSYGRIHEAKIVTDRKTGKCKGFGFVTFATEEGMDEAIEAMNGEIFDGCNITVSKAKPKGNRSSSGTNNGSRQPEEGGGGGAEVEVGKYQCHVSNLAWETDEQALEAAFSRFGELLDKKVIWRLNPKDGLYYSKGYGFVTFASDKDMKAAIEGMDGKELDGRNVIVKPAKAKGNNGTGDSRNDGGRRSTTTEGGYICFVGGLSWKTEKLTLEKVFGRFGVIIKAEVKCYKDENGMEHSRGYGFVTFETEESMLDAIKWNNGKMIDGRHVTVQEAKPKEIRSR